MMHKPEWPVIMALVVIRGTCFVMGENNTEKTIYRVDAFQADRGDRSQRLQKQVGIETTGDREIDITIQPEGVFRVVTFQGVRYRQILARKLINASHPWNPLQEACFPNAERAIVSSLKTLTKTIGSNHTWKVMSISCRQYTDTKKWYWSIDISDGRESISVLATWSGHVPNLAIVGQIKESPSGLSNDALASSNNFPTGYGWESTLSDGRKYWQVADGSDLLSMDSYYPERGIMPTNSNTMVILAQREIEKCIPGFSPFRISVISLERVMPTRNKFVYSFEIDCKKEMKDTQPGKKRAYETLRIGTLTDGAVPKIIVENTAVQNNCQNWTESPDSD